MKTTSSFWPRIAWPGVQVHVFEGVLERPPGRRIGLRPSGAGIRRADRQAHARVRAVGDHRLEARGVDRDRSVVARRRHRWAARASASTAASQAAPFGACGRPCDVLERGVVGRDQAGPGAALDAHVADGHPLLHRQAADRRAGVFEDVAGPAADADPGDQGQDDVLGADARRRAGRRPGPRTSSAGAGAGTGWRGPSRPRSCRSRRPARRTRRGWPCASRRTRSSCPAGSGRAPGR